VQHGCARVAGAIPHHTVALGLWGARRLFVATAIPHSTVALGLRAVFHAARLRSEKLFTIHYTLGFLVLMLMAKSNDMIHFP
jgi:hypothetical protein